ncbi:nucleotidyltransferase family protein [Carbonactinospora thermoautotrophica]|uniref:nucleotidyltransferase family protein n=1 Tax=Carbonactinospora thermoautotrophica TaxID=1469144 RepID=UPI00083720C9|nr:nucleotidyltransferase family protein [Carbonactinospora thermoautotrophica]
MSVEHGLSSTTSHEVVGIVLGAGASTRLGRPKQLLPLGDTTVLSWVVARVERSSLDRVVVVVGGGDDDVVRSLSPGRARIVRNDAYGSGCASSLLAGLDAAGECAAVMLLLGDMPEVDTPVIDEVLARWRARPSWAAVTSYRGQLGHPFVFSAAAFPTLRGLHGDKAVWKIVDQAPPERLQRFAVDRPLPRDIDTWEDYVEVCAALGVPVGSRSE